MCAKPVQRPRAVVERSRIDFQHGDQVVFQTKNSLTDTPYIQNHAGLVEMSVRDIDGRFSEFIIRPLGPGSSITFHVVDELPDDWKHRIRRKRCGSTEGFRA